MRTKFALLLAFASFLAVTAMGTALAGAEPLSESSVVDPATATTTTAVPSLQAPACANGVDDDGDGLADTGDADCESAEDPSEAPSAPAPEPAEEEADPVPSPEPTPIPDPGKKPGVKQGSGIDGGGGAAGGKDGVARNEGVVRPGDG
ncbi:MAG TPA: hypothetical protein VN179_00210, partial [Solirubrobacterales bacterium]|nr:hypothetical protein [Solirubrobacterales bacterium]